MLFLGASTGEWLQECYPSALGILVLGWRDDSPGLPLLLSCLGVATLYICHAKRWRKRSKLRRFVQFPAPFSSLFDTCGAPGRLSPRLASRPNLSQEYPLSRAKYILALPVKIYNEAIVYMIVQPKAGAVRSLLAHNLRLKIEPTRFKARFEFIPVPNMADLVTWSFLLINISALDLLVQDTTITNQEPHLPFNWRYSCI